MCLTVAILACSLSSHWSGVCPRISPAGSEWPKVSEFKSAQTVSLSSVGLLNSRKILFFSDIYILYIFVYLYIYVCILYIFLCIFVYLYIYRDIPVYLLKLLILKSSNNTCSHFSSNHSLAGCAAKGSAGSSACVSLLLENFDQKEIELHQRHFNAT